MTNAPYNLMTLLTVVQETAIETKRHRLDEVRQLLAELKTGAEAA